ncbi:MAG: phosphoribosylanthranilate isomerase [Deltaproteobacteria bacterium]|nr:MAG: phosphoribosylanthranilate isomerase [Deltaproteobacteria bacterium]
MSGSVRIKVCGIMDPEAAQACVEAGVDLIGLNFVPGSPRQIDARTGAAIAQSVAGRIERVAVFRDAQWDEIERVLRAVDVERIQLHGDEEPEAVEELDLPVVKAIRGADAEAAERYPGAILLLDHPTEGGGRGKAWEWREAGALIESGYDVILSGGLNPDNVGQALADLGDLLPWGVDVATGVEADGHRKDPALIRAFIAAVRKAEGEEEAS